MRIVPLGGLGEVGMNCLALEVDGEVLVIDCGVTFPKTDLGIEIYHPDFTWLEHHRDAIRGLVLTHGHEDHIGAIPYFMRRFDVPIWGPAYALELTKVRLREHRLDRLGVALQTTLPKRVFRVGNFEIEPVHVTHSIGDAHGLIVRTKAGTLVHTGDFKLDPQPTDGKCTDEARFRQAGDEGVQLLLSDSTNIDAHGTSGSEATAAEVLGRLVETSTGRVVVGMFASNVHRLRTLGKIALATGRKLVLLGRSVQTHTRIAMEQHQLTWPSDLLVAPEHAMATPRSKVLVIASGTQAERLAALMRIALRTHQHIQLDPGDRAIFSSRIIPGNEPAVMEMVGNLLRQGVDVRLPLTDPGVHVSGHAYRDEQARMIDMVQPHSFVPIHGNLHHLYRHAELAVERGVRSVLVLENGEIAHLSQVDATLKKAEEHAPVGKIPTANQERIPEQVLQEREAIARAGVALVTVVVNSYGRPAGPVSVATRGVPPHSTNTSILRDAEREVSKALRERWWPNEYPTDEEIAEVARTTARKKIEQFAGKKPVALANVIRVGP